MKAGGAKGFDAYAHHPYYELARGDADDEAAAGSRGQPPTAITLGNFDTLVAELNRLYGKRVRIWITEYGYQTNPPDRIAGVTYAKQAAYLTQAVAFARKHPQIDIFLWFLLRDEGRLGGWQSGLTTVGGVRKPSFNAFRRAALARVDGMAKGYAEGPAAEEAERRREELADGVADAPREHAPRGRGMHRGRARAALPRVGRRGRPGRAVRLGRGLGHPRRAPARLSRRRPARSGERGTLNADGQRQAGRAARAVIIRFAGDSGDGMQLTGDRFTSETATLGNDLATFPDFPAEIRAPAGSLPGVSGFQVHFADHDILTAGDRPDVLVAMNPAALKTNIADLPKGGTIIVNTDAFNDRTLQKAGYAANPLEDGSLADYHLHEVALTSMTVGALKGIEGITSREAERSKNFFALGLMSWLYHRPVEGTIAFIEQKFAKRPEIVEANTKAFRAGLELRRDVGGLRRLVRGRAGAARARHLPADHRATPRSRTASSPRPSCPGCRSSSARTRSRRPRRSWRSSPAARSSASSRSRPRTRSPRWAPRSARRSEARSASRPPPAPGSCSRRRRSGSRSRSSCRS